MNKSGSRHFQLLGAGMILVICLLGFYYFKERRQAFLSEANKMMKLAESAATNEVYVETANAGLVLAKMHDQGRLPGDPKHGDLTADTVQMMISNQIVVMTYPAFRTFRFVKTGETTTNIYTLVKQSKDSEWKLKRAWQTDSNGQVIQEWPIK